MNHWIYSADRTTHLKIVVLALLVSTGVASCGIAAHFKNGNRYSETAYVLKAGKPGLRFAAALSARQDSLSELTLRWHSSSTLIAPEWNERVSAREVQYLFRCLNCQNEFVTLLASDEEPFSVAEITKPFFTSVLVE